MVKQNGGKFRRLKKKNHKKIAFRRNQKIRLGNVFAWYVDLDEKIIKIRYGHLYLKKKNKKNNFAGGLVSGLEISFAAN